MVDTLFLAAVVLFSAFRDATEIYCGQQRAERNYDPRPDSPATNEIVRPNDASLKVKFISLSMEIGLPFFVAS